jgi:glycerol uptake facilitator-like aquaporin
MALQHTHDSSHLGDGELKPFWIPIVVPVAAAVFAALIFVASAFVLTQP